MDKSIEQEELYKAYLSKQSKEFKEDIIGYEPFYKEGVDLCIKVNFTWGWLRIYKRDNVIEWY